MGARFIVLKLKEVIRIVVIAVVGLAAVTALIIALTRRGGGGANDGLGLGLGLTDNVSRYNPGTYSATIILYNKPLDVLVTVDGDSITNVTMSEPNEAQEVFYPLFKPTIEALADEIVRGQSTDIQPSTEAMYTGRILLDAVNYALSQAETEMN